MDFLYIIVSIAFAFWVIRNVLFWTYLWQSKEYRVDRLLIHLRETFQGRQLLLSQFSLAKWAILIIGILLSAVSANLLVIELLIAVLYIIEFFIVLREATTYVLFRPKFTLKAITIIALSIVALFGLYSFRLLDDEFIWLLAIDRAVPFIVSFFVILFIIPTNLYKEWTIEKAMKKIQKNDKLIVIGIAGSYGKTTTKEYLSQIIRKKFPVVKTAKNYSTAFAIAETILDKLTNRTKVFIAEMGMYTAGEMQQMCEIIHPTIAVITGVNAQHASVSGGLRENIEAKYELIANLPKNGLALFNGEDENALKLYNRTRKNRVLYSASPKRRSNFHGIYAKNIKVYKPYLTFDAMIDTKHLLIKAPLIGEQNVNSLLAAIYLAYYLGMSLTDIKHAVSKLTQPPQTMNKVEGQNGATFIDDTLNTNPHAIDAALSYLSLYKGKKVFVMQPMDELGEEAYTVHYNLAKKMSAICDYLFLTNKNFSKPIMKGVHEGKGECEVRVATVAQISEFIKDTVQKGDIVLFEGREAGIILQKLM